MSPRAAWRLEALGFADVWDYVAGKLDWLSHGLPSEGTAADEPTAGAAADGSVPTCGLDERLAEVRSRVREAGWDTCVVVNEANVVLGRLGRETLASDEDGRVEDFMSEGPSTVRPYVLFETVAGRLRERGLAMALVTTSDGRLVGVVHAGEGRAPLR